MLSYEFGRICREYCAVMIRTNIRHLHGMYEEVSLRLSLFMDVCVCVCMCIHALGRRII